MDGKEIAAATLCGKKNLGKICECPYSELDNTETPKNHFLKTSEKKKQVAVGRACSLNPEVTFKKGKKTEAHHDVVYDIM
jgi:hypothetical protein